MNRLLLPLAAFLATAISADAAAQSKRVETSQREREEIRGIQLRFGDCVVKTRYTASRQFVLTPAFDDPSERRKAVDKVADGDCLASSAAMAGGVEMRFPSDTMRYALADALVRREFATLAPSIRDAAPLVQPGLDEADYVPKPGRKAKQAELLKMAENPGKRVALIYLAAYGECIVRADVSRSHALILSQPESASENAVFGSLTSTLSDCLAAGQSLSFSKSVLRGTIAMNFYRLAHAPRLASTVSGAPR